MHNSDLKASVETLQIERESESERNKIPNTSKFIEFAMAREYDKGNFSITDDKQIHRLSNHFFLSRKLPVDLFCSLFSSIQLFLFPFFSLFLFYCVSNK